MDISKRSDELIRKSVSKLIQCILLSRVDVPPSQRLLNKTFHLELEESEIIQKTIESMIFARSGYRVCFLLDIYFDETSGVLNSIVESWRFLFEPLNIIDSSIELPKFYKNTIILVRTLYSLLRNLPCFTIFKNFSKIKSNSSSLKYTIRTCDSQSIYIPAFNINTSTKIYQFTPIPTPIGTFKLELTYRDNLRKEIDLSSQLSLNSQFIINEYNNNNFKPMMMNTGSNNNNSGLGYGSTQPIPVRMNSYPDLSSLNTKNSNSNNSNINLINNRPNSNPNSSGGPGSLGIDSYLNFSSNQNQNQNSGSVNNNEQLHRTNSNNNMYNIINNSGGATRSNPISIGTGSGNSGGGGSYSVSPPFSTSPPFTSGNKPPLPGQSPVYIGPTSGNSPPFSSSSNNNNTMQPSGPLPIRQVNFTLPQQSTSPNQQQQPPFHLNQQQITTHRNRSISAPINIVNQQQQQQQAQNTNYGGSGGKPSSTSNKSPPFHVGVSPFKEPSSLDFYTKKGSSPLGGGINPNALSSSYSSGNSINSLKNSSSVSQIHGPLLVSNFSLKELNKVQSNNMIGYGYGGNSGGGGSMGMGISNILDMENEEPVFAPSLSSSKTMSSTEDVSDFVKLCQLAPPLKLFENNFQGGPSHHLHQHLQQLQLNNDIIELSNITFVNKSTASPIVPTHTSAGSNNNAPINNNNNNITTNQLPPTYKVTYQTSNWNS